MKGAVYMRFNNMRPIYKNVTEEKNAVTKKYQKVYGEIIRQRENGILTIKGSDRVAEI